MSVHSKKEWDFVKNRILLGVTENVWIGGYQPNNGKVWKWDDESAFDFEHWEEDNPNGNGFCMYLWASQRHEWADAPCDQFQFPFMCMM